MHAFGMNDIELPASSQKCKRGGRMAAQRVAAKDYIRWQERTILSGRIVYNQQQEGC